jgi:hypothetical protein
LGFQGHDPGAQALERGGAVTQVGADVEDEVSRVDEIGVEASQPTLATGSPVDHQGTGDAQTTTESVAQQSETMAHGLPGSRCMELEWAVQSKSQLR